MNKTAKKISTFAAAALMIQALIYVVLSLLSSRIDLEDSVAAQYILFAAFSAVVNIVPAMIMKFFSEKTFGKAPARLPKTSAEKNDDILFTAGCAALVFAVGVIYGRIFPEAAANIPITAETPFYIHILIILAVCAVPSVCEEIFFRRYIANALAVSSNTAAVMISSLVFALAHFSIWDFPRAFLAGLVFGALYFKTKSVIHAIAAHFFCNFTTYLFICAKTVMPSEAYNTFEMVSTATFIAVAVATAIIYLKSKTSRKRGADGKADASSLITPAMIVYIVAAGLIIVFYR